MARKVAGNGSLDLGCISSMRCYILLIFGGKSCVLIPRCDFLAEALHATCMLPRSKIGTLGPF